MIIGIVSKEDHCQSHVKGLTADGFDVRVLGGDPISTPPSVKILVVRTDSCSRAAWRAALNWGRQPGHTLVVENGLSGIRRRLQDIVRLQAEPDSMKVKSRSAHGSSPSIVTDIALHGVLSPAPFNPIVLPATPPKLPEIKESPVATYSFLLPLNWPHTQSWTNSISKERLSRDCSAAHDMVKTLDPTLLSSLAAKIESPHLDREFFKNLAQNPKIIGLKGKPLQWIALVLFCTKAGVIDARHLIEAYYHFNDGKATNLQTVQAVAWATSKAIVVSAPTHAKGSDLETLQPRSIPRVEAQQTFESSLQGELARLSAINADLTKKVAALETRVTQVLGEFDSLTAGIRSFNRKLNDRIEALEAVDFTDRVEKSEAQVRLLTERLDELETRPSPAPVAPVKASDTLLDALDQIRSRGGDVTIVLPRTMN